MNYSSINNISNNCSSSSSRNTPITNISSSAINNNIHHDDEDESDSYLDGMGQPWTCNMCTFQNHPLLNKCEQCEMPLLPSSSGTVLSPVINATQSMTTMPHQLLSPQRLHHIPHQQQSATQPTVVHNPYPYASSSLGCL